MALEAGTQLGPYTITAPIGSGGMGQVYRARDHRLDRDIAIKVLPESLSRDTEALARFEREAKILAALSHPNILAVYDVGQEQGVRYVVTELLEGGTLRDKISRAPLPWKRALELSIAIAEGLSAAHTRGVTHRDLKPENIFITSDGHVKILDFGLATGLAAGPASIEHSTDTQPGTIIGTVEYMSPEQVRGTGVDMRSDIFSFGCLIYEMVSGKRPFTRKTAADTMVAILKEEVSSLVDDGIPLELDRIILHCLEKHPEQRFQSARDLTFDLRSIWHDSGILRTSPMVSASTNKRPWLFASIVIGAALVAALVYGALHFNAPTGTIDSIAVMPFENSSADPDTDYLSDGLTDSIINSLSRNHNLKVMARSSMFRFKGKDSNPQEAGQSLHVGAVLQGRVLRQQNKIIIRTELVRVSDGTQLWGDSYTRQITDVLGVEQEISSKIVENLRLKLEKNQQAPTATAGAGAGEAYQSYLKGRYFWNKRTESDLKKAIELFQKSADFDPAFAPAFAGLADSYNLMTDYMGVPPNEACPRAKAAAEKALQLDESLAEAHTSLAYVLSVYDWNWRGAEREFLRAIELSPNYATAHHWYGWHLAMEGRLVEARDQIRIAQELDPLSPSIQANAALFYYFSRDNDQAIARCRSILAINPDAVFVHYYMGLALEQKGKLDEAASEFKRAIAGENGGAGNMSALARIYFQQGKEAEGQALIQQLHGLEKTQYISPGYYARIYAARGDSTETLEALEQARSLRDELTIWIKVDPRFDPLRKDAQFQQFMKSIGFP